MHLYKAGSQASLTSLSLSARWSFPDEASPVCSLGVSLTHPAATAALAAGDLKGKRRQGLGPAGDTKSLQKINKNALLSPSGSALCWLLGPFSRALSHN
jgi:hypothetical protein